MNTSTYQHFEVKPLAPALGAEILGVDVRSLDDDVLAEIKRAYTEFSVIFFRDQKLEPEDHIAFAKRFGHINVNRFFTPVADYPNIAEVRKEADERRNIGESWHTDHSYDQEPAMGSILYALDTPPIGGDTLFASMSRVYESLSEGLQHTLCGLNAVHSSRHTFGVAAIGDDIEAKKKFHNAELATQDAIHPMVITHPLSGRKVLYVNPDFTVGIEGWSIDESASLLDYLYKQAAKPEFQCRFQWRTNSIAFWDNRATWHCALNDYHGYRRHMNRITLEGEALRA
jgi:taurine dioxygenase